MRERLYAMRIPRAYLFSEKGFPDEDFDQLPRHGIQPLVVGNSGHDMMFDNPVGVAEVIKQAHYQPAERG
jgi:hypothetical protein